MHIFFFLVLLFVVLLFRVFLARFMAAWVVGFWLSLYTQTADTLAVSGKDGSHQTVHTRPHRKYKT